jgi:hypothetical protein
MGWRTLIVRTPVVAGLVLIVLGAILYQYWTDPRAVRQMLLDRLSEKFIGATVRLESAQLRLLGGISFSELRMTRRDALDGSDFLYVPSGIIFHDKERLLDGCLGIRKLELNRPVIRIVRERDGKFNLQGLFAPAPPDHPVPTTVLHQATLQIEDREASPGTPLLELRGAEVTVVNDPLPTITVEGRGTTDILGPIKFKMTANRPEETLALQLTLEAIPLGADLVQRIALLAPAVKEHLRGLKGLASFDLDLTLDPKVSLRPSFEVRGKIERGEIALPAMPLPLEKITASFKVSNRVTPGPTWPTSLLGIYLPSVHLEANFGKARAQIDATGLAIPDHVSGLDYESLVATLDSKIEHVDVTDKVMATLPPNLENLEPDFQPRGPATVAHTFRRHGPHQWNSEWHITFEGMRARFHEVPYPLHDVRGTVVRTNSHAGTPVMSLDLTGKAGDEEVRLTGKLTGPSPAAIDLRITGENLKADDTFLGHLPAKPRAIARQFHPAGRFGLDVTVHRDQGSHKFRNRYLIRLRDGFLLYDLFPYALERVEGELEVRTDGGSIRWEARNLRGQHNGAEIQVEARDVPAGDRLDDWPGSKVRTPSPPSVARAPLRTVSAIQVRMRGSNVPVDRALEEALAPPTIPTRQQLQKTWQTMNPTGKINFAAEVIDLPEIPNSIAVSVAVHGCRIQPRFFELPLDRLEGVFHYGQGRVDLVNLQAYHAAGRLALPEGVVYLKPAGGYQVRLGRLQVQNMTASPEFIRALPAALRKTLETLQFRGVFNLATALVLDAPEGNGPPFVWWDGGLGLRDGTVNFGIDVSGITGQFSCTGQHNGQTLETASGNVLLEEAAILKQPLRQIQAAFEFPREHADRLLLRNLKAGLFGGILAGEGHVHFAPSLRYDLMFKVLQVDLEQFGRHNFPETGAELQGQVGAALHLVGEGTNLSDLRGNGRIEIPRGKLYRLPWTLDLLKTISLQVPDRTAFEKARATFSIEGPRMLVQDLELHGNAINLRGNGSLNLDGTNLALDFSTDLWGKVLPPGLNDLPRWMSDQLFQIKVRGKLGQVRYEKELMPRMLAPLKQAMTGN